MSDCQNRYISPRADFEMKHSSATGNSGCEDPRIVRIDDTLHMTYTAYDGVRPPCGAVSSISVDDFLARNWQKWSAPFILTPDGVDDKDLALLPEKINGNYLLYHRVNKQICADILPDLSSDKRASRCIEVMSASARNVGWNENRHCRAPGKSSATIG